MDEHISEYSSFEAHLRLFSITYWVIPPSPRASNLPQALFAFWSSFRPPQVACWGIPSFPGIIGPFRGFVIFWPSCRSSWVVILGHIPSDQVCLHHYLSYPLALGHLINSFIIFSIQLEFGAAPISIGHVHRLVSFSLSQCRTYIDRSFILSVWVFGTAPISIGHSSFCQFQFESGSHLYQSTIFLSFPRQFEFFRTAPISISHCHVSSVSSWDRTYIDRSSSYWFSSIWVFQDRTYINWSSFYQFNSIWVFRSAPISIGHRLVSLSLGFWGCTYINRSSSYQFVFSLSWDRTYINLSLSCQFEFSLSF